METDRRECTAHGPRNLSTKPIGLGAEKGNGSAALEEERRGCFVAVTRAGKRLILSRAKRYRGWTKAPSRFLKEMGCLGDHGADTAARRTG